MLPYINIPFEYFARSIGASPDELKLVTSFVISYPLAALLKRIPDESPALKNLFNIGVSVFYLVGLFDLWDGVRTLAISSVATYLIAKYVNGPFMPWIIFVFVMGHLSISHLSRQFVNNPGLVDITGAQMVLVIKLTSFSWNVADGRLPESELNDFQKERAIKELPSLLDFAGYIMFFPSLFAGPAFDFIDYKRWISTTMFEVPVGTSPSERAPTRKKRKIPRSGIPATWKAVTGIIWIALFLKLSPWYYPSYLTGAEYMTKSFTRRIWILHMLGITSRTKYYGVWALTEGACILSGIGYSGIDPATGKVSWDRSQNVNPWGVETAQNIRTYLNNWNMNTNNWLRNYVYLRVTPKGKKPGFGASMATFVTSAFWHGFYPGYYLTFVLGSFVQTTGRNFRRYVRPFFLAPSKSTTTPPPPTKYKICYDIFSYLVTQVGFSFIVVPFLLLTLSDTLLVWGRVYFYGVIATAASTIFFASPAKGFLVKKLKQRTGGGRPVPEKMISVDGLASREPLLGLPVEPQEDLEELVEVVRSGLTARHVSAKEL